MSNRDDLPTDLLDAIARLDDIAEWLEAEGYGDDGGILTGFSAHLRGYVRVSIHPPPKFQLSKLKVER